MKTGFTYKGIHSDTFGITLKTQDRPIIPSVKSKSYSALCMDGSYSFDSANPYKRGFYDERIFLLALQIHGENLSDLERKMSGIAVWLIGSGELIFDDTPFVKWQARCSDNISFAPEIRGKKAVITVQFTVYPFARSIISTLSGFTIDADIPLDFNIPIGINSLYTGILTSSAASETKSVSIAVPNIGDRPARPVITVSAPEGAAVPSAYFTKVTLSNGENTLTVSNRGSTGTIQSLSVDFERQSLSSNGTVTGIEGEFFELPAGNTYINVTMDTVNQTLSSVDYTVTVDFTPEFVWNLDFDTVDWG